MGQGSHFPQLQAPAAHPQSAQVQPSVPQPGILVYMFGRKGLGKKKGIDVCVLNSCVADFVAGREKGSKKRGTKTESGVFISQLTLPRADAAVRTNHAKATSRCRSGRTILWFTLARVYIGPGRLRFLAG